MTIDAGTREISALLQITDTSKYFQYLARLEISLTASADGGDAPDVGPVTRTRVGILDVCPFPNNHDYQYLDLRDHDTRGSMTKALDEKDPTLPRGGSLAQMADGVVHGVAVDSGDVLL